MATESLRIHQTIKFGEDFELDLNAYQLRRSDRVLKLEPTPMELLSLLLEHRGELVTREEIIERIWGQGVFLDTDNSINGAIRKIRIVLKDDSESPRFVQTVSGKGYRFIAPVTTRPDSRGVGRPPVEVPVSQVTNQSGIRRGHIFLVAVILVVAAAGVFGYQRWRNRSRPPDGRVMLAVLPFENLTGDAGQDYFSDGMTEEMIAQLGQLDASRLGVIARTSVMNYRQRREPLSQIARELGVQYVLEGSVRRDASSMRITAQLIQANDQTHLWSRQYDRELGSLLAVQAEIAQEIADRIQLTLDTEKRNTLAKQSSVSPETYAAYDLYLKGRYFWNKRSSDGFQRAIECFQQAIAKDANYARAYAGLADSYALLGGYTAVPQKEFALKARAAALKALRIDDRLAEAHVSLAVIAQNYDWDWRTAEEEYRRAIQLNSNYATAHHWYAELLSYQGRFDDAFVEIERAQQLDPLSLIIATDKGAILYYSRQYDLAIKQFRTVLEMEPGFPRARLIVFPYVEKNQFSSALALLEKWPQRDDPWNMMMTIFVYSRSGQMVLAKNSVHRLEKLTQSRQMDPGPLLFAYVSIGDKEKAIAWLEKAYLERSTALTSLKVNPLYDPLRSDPRFQSYLRRVGLANQ